MRLVSYRQGTEAGIGVMLDDQRFVSLAKAAPRGPVLENPAVADVPARYEG